MLHEVHSSCRKEMAETLEDLIGNGVTIILLPQKIGK